ncbi:hypothetical protein IW140_003673 [Coemansia sp. RSA 1813]|nr:hypothetical protein EV178_002638 [Coemansia sp. RSA 1646]KAJ1770737.1 hypothetical protein LPJ74_002940 [Coemansia sp. RSA 1843]KAJ2088777.1 hypothetical protein IW138_003951 [Coemansia sp. RSA 986]KAJ2213713.1 hypothetical protein EV179_003613 [Coemansia sp. RSA 487]KAJ2568684.1 hypothetical protein IW140_003673 [Coemansia sp. RSA 1813]
MAIYCDSQQPKPLQRQRNIQPSEPKDTTSPTIDAKPAASDNDIHKPNSEAAESAYTFGQVAPGGSASSPSWSTSSISNNSDDYNGSAPAPPGLLPQNKAANELDLGGLLFDSGACSLEQGAQQWLAVCSQEMFPTLLAPTALHADATAKPSPHHSPASSAAGLAFGAHRTTVSAATHPENISNTTTDAALDGWLQQFVNADAIGGATTAALSSSPSSHVTSTAYSPDLPFYSGADAASVAALLSSSASPGLSGIASQSGVFSFESATAASVPALPGILPLQASPVMQASPSQSPLSTGADALDQSTVNAFAAAAAAAAVASSSSLPSSIESISPELLASVLSSAAGMYTYNSGSSTIAEPQELLPPAASEISMLAALPFTSIALPAANIAPQKTLSVSRSDGPGSAATVPDVAASSVSQPVVSSLPLPPAKRPRRSAPSSSLRKAPRQGTLESNLADISSRHEMPVTRVENVSGGRIGGSSNHGSDTGTDTTVPKKCATASTAPESSQPKAVSQASTPPSRLIAPASSPVAGNRSHNVVSLAPRQQPAHGSHSSLDNSKQLKPKGTVAQKKPTKDTKLAEASASSRSSSPSGSSTPPGLSVLAKIAQKQVPIRVKEEEEEAAMALNANTTNQQQNYQGRLIAPSPANRQTRSPSLPPTKVEANQSSPVTSATDSTAQKRQERLIKNRAAALLSRKRKRDYMTKLESEVEDLRTSNTSLVKRMEEMERAMKALAEERDRLRCENEAARASVSAAPASSTGAATSTSAANNNNSNTTPNSTTSEKDTKEKNESSETSGAKNGDVEASDDTMDIDSDSRPLGDVQQRGSSSGGNNKQRTAGALLMAMLFSFSLFTLPSLYTSSNQITAGGPQSAGIIPIQSLPSPEPRLLIGSGNSAKASDIAVEPPLIERVRRSITALTQQADPHQATDSGAPQYANGSSSSSNWMRPMTMEESAQLHAWIRHGLAPKGSSNGNSVIAPNSDVAHAGVESLKVSTARANSVSNSLSVVHQQPRKPNDYAMLYCPAMQHVVFSGDSLEVADTNGYLTTSGSSSGSGNALVYKPSAPRVIDTAKHPSERGSGTFAVVHGGMDDVDHEIITSPRVGGVADWHSASAAAASQEEEDVRAADLVPTHAGGVGMFAASSNRPKLSLYSPIVGGRGGGGGDSGILPPWDEYARLAASSSESSETPAAEVAAASRQKYLRIDVEVVGSRWVTADKFAHGLY